MNNKLLYLFIFVLSVFFSKETQAGTDVLSNVLTNCNTVLKEVGEVQNKYSGKIRQILSMKISPAELLRSVGAGKLVDAAERVQQRGEIMKEKADKVKERMEFAKENFDELKSKYDELNQKANAAFAEAKAMMDEGKAILESAKGKYEKGKALFEEGKAMYESAKAGIEQGIEIGREVVNTAQELSGQKPQDKNLVNASIAEAMMQEAEKMKAEAKRENMSAIDIKEGQFTPINRESEISAVPTANSANAIVSASKFAENTDIQMNLSEGIPNISEIKGKELNIKANDIIKKATSIDRNNPLVEKEIKTDVEMNAQLLNTVNKVDIKEKVSALSDSSVKEMKDTKKQDVRVKFGEKKELIKKEPQKIDLKDQEMLKAKDLAERAAKKMSKQALSKNDKKLVSPQAQLQKVNTQKANDIKAKIVGANSLKNAPIKAVDKIDNNAKQKIDNKVSAQISNLQKASISKGTLTAKENINVR